mmetsp:Transcript_18859/g.28515  ORF Transcript_18859/g.28515 Transcript_18859/m.28515 type:complete len:222 (+) Transcript_18859:40-705(+)
MVTRQGTPSGTFWSICTRARLICCSCRMMSPPRPMMRPTTLFGQSSVCVFGPGVGVTSSVPASSPRTSAAPARAASSVPVICTCRSTPSGKFWSTCILQPLRACSSRMVSPPRPMMRPTSPGAQGTVSVTKLTPGGGCVASGGPFSITSRTEAAAAPTLLAGPVMITLRATPLGMFWSIWIVHPVEACSHRMVSPPRPIRRPTRLSAQSTVSAPCSSAAAC